MKLFGIELGRPKQSTIESQFNKKARVNVQASWTEGATDPANLMIYDWASIGTDQTEAMSYQSIVYNLIRRYNGLTPLGRELTKSIIDTRVTWIAGNGVNITANGKRETEFLDKFIKYNKLDGITFRDKVTDSELEGKVLGIPEWKAKDQMVDVKWLNWSDTSYKIETDPDDYRVITGVTYGLGGGKRLNADLFVYRSFTGTVRFLNESPPRVGMQLFSIDAASSALRDLRRINRKFGAAFPFFEMSTHEDAKNLIKAIDQRKWRIGDTIAAVGKGYYMEPNGSGLESIIKEILMHFRFISQGTGIPVYFMAPDLMSNRSTAQELLEMVNAATMSERENWKDFITELCSQAMKIYTKKTGIILDYEDVTVSIPSVTLNQVQQLVDVYLPLMEAGIVSKKFLREKVPDSDPDQELKEIERENEMDTPDEPDPIKQLTKEMNTTGTEEPNDGTED
jgi:hypothetical protein